LSWFTNFSDLELAEYNTTKYFSGNISLATHSAMADEFWDRIQSGNSSFVVILTSLIEIYLAGGVVSVDTDWALRHFKPSTRSPDNSEQSIYQVDVFHSIHCLVCSFLCHFVYTFDK